MYHNDSRRGFPEDIPVTWKQQVQAAVECQNAGARSRSAAKPQGRQRGFIGSRDDGEGARRAGITASDSHPMARCSVAPGTQESGSIKETLATLG